MKDGIFRKVSACGILVLFVSISTMSFAGSLSVERVSTTSIKKSYMPINSRGNTLYVGGIGPNNYTSIQSAINDANNGDTVFVYNDSSPYYEHVTVTKSINLIGEDKDTTIIDSSYGGAVVSIYSDWVNISGFTIKKSGYAKGISIYSNHTIITGNNIISNNNQNGIYLYESSNNNIITGNNISNHHDGIHLYYSSGNIITGNNISSQIGDYGMDLEFSSNNNIITGNNIILNNNYGISITDSSNNNKIYYNNFIDNKNNAIDGCKNIWDDGKYGNYWSDYKERYPDAKPRTLKPWMWNTPYEIPGGNNKDMCPLIKQWSDPLSKSIPEIQQSSLQINQHSSNQLLLKMTERFTNRFILFERLLNFQ